MAKAQDQIDAARLALASPRPRASVAGTLAAAVLAATAAVLMAGVMILGPGIALDDAVPIAGQPT